ncbi:ABC transporter ATP-binding protein/permease [Jiella sp. MQZ9-1]|uniref:ABC transporter ATP-binding protein n=1 Tax=Jiella flava TaxID=2816857 RepID=A0A939FXC1_9HYPH|nr:ABC transporter ATP-binding protein [Jiella flava]MBO0662604.1 ABC transporter ATP-binding protein [Jiella flava]MCD2471026.1 ABC transporter ATP-binding protein/permease [Jiella flava]
MFSKFERMVDAFPAPELNAPPPKTLAKFIWFFARPFWPLFLAMAVITALISTIEVSLFGFLGHLVDWFGDTPPDRFLAERGWQLALMGVVIMIVLPGIQFIDGLVSFQALFGNFPMRFRFLMHRWLLGHSLSFFQDEFAGRVSQKLMQTALAVRETVGKSIDVFLYVAVYFTGVVILAASSDWKLALPFVGWLILYAVMLRWFIPRLDKVAESQADARAEMTGRIVDAYANVQTVKLFAHTRREADYARQSMGGFLTTVYGQGRLITLFVFCLQSLNSLLLFTVGAAGIGLWVNGLVTVGAIAASVGLVLRIHGMSQWIMWEVSALFENIGTIRDGMATLSIPHAITDRPQAPPLAVPKGEIRFEKVSFHYGKDGGVLSDFGLTIRPGEKVGLIGRSGAGKSTILNLLMRFHDVESGRILIDGTDIRDVGQESLRARIGMVTQDTSLLHRSIRDNVLYGRPDAGEAALEAAVRRAEAADFVAELRDRDGRTGLDAEVGERGVKLSGGQRQRIAIARVMLKDAPILLLDEATSALDSEVEAAIAENLYRLMEGKTVIAVAHRLSTIAALDRLIVLDKGAIVETGSHAELVAQGGLYAKLWSRQVGGFLAAGDSDEAQNGTAAAGMRAAE